MIPGLLRILLICCAVLPRPVAGAGWKIATWNLQNYLVQNRFEDGKFRLSYPMPESRKRKIRDLILAENPDVLFLQELGDERFLLELQLDLSARGLVYPYYQFSGFDEARSGLAWLARFPPKEAVFHDLSMRRGVQEIRFQSQSGTVRFFHVHLKSRYSEDPDDRYAHKLRKLEIALLANALDALRSVDPDSQFVIVGDFNTPFQDPLLDALKTNWMPVEATDRLGNPHTYFHRSGSADVLDGFWVPCASTLAGTSGRILPLPQLCPSDHRCVIFHLHSTP